MLYQRATKVYIEPVSEGLIASTVSILITWTQADAIGAVAPAGITLAAGESCLGGITGNETDGFVLTLYGRDPLLDVYYSKQLTIKRDTQYAQFRVTPGNLFYAAGERFFVVHPTVGGFYAVSHRYFKGIFDLDTMTRVVEDGSESFPVGIEPFNTIFDTQATPESVVVHNYTNTPISGGAAVDPRYVFQLDDNTLGLLGGPRYTKISGIHSINGLQGPDITIIQKFKGANT